MERPVAIADHTFDMKLPPDDDSEEVERGRPRYAPPFIDDTRQGSILHWHRSRLLVLQRTGHTLSVILRLTCRSIRAIQP
ncbi:hypothetical protein VTO73DRAFT_9797 [Trametes versicolor]